MSKEIIIDPAYTGYVYMGNAHGLFEPRNSENGEKQPYFNMYVVSPVSSFSSEDYKASGMKCEKLKCLDAKVWGGLVPGDRVVLFFDDKKRVILAQKQQ